ncbi:MAG TPA: hypothetical protein VFK90_03675 [Anaeromyxobacter sp.]|nr:hypothetical protein [Anaeromyxobacter sp.]
MTEIAKGMLVQHESLGVGKVVAVEATAVHVFFPGAEKRFAAKLRWPAARPLLRADGVERDAWLEGLSSFTLDRAEGRYALAATWMTHDQAIAGFLAEYPQGFEDPAYLGTGAGARRARARWWRAAGAEWAAAMGNGEADRLLAAGEVRELVRRAVRIDKHLALVPGTFEQGVLKQALEDPDAALPFFAALFEMLAAPPARGRTEKLFAAAEALDVEPALAWPIATVFPFVADPARYVFLWPRTACAAAERLGCDLRFDALPNWATYAALRAFSAQLLARLEASGARDFVDVEAFLHTTAASRASASAKARAERAEPRARAARRTR